MTEAASLELPTPDGVAAERVTRLEYLRRHHELTESSIGIAKLRLMRSDAEGARRALDDCSTQIRKLFSARLRTMDVEAAEGAAEDIETLSQSFAVAHGTFNEALKNAIKHLLAASDMRPQAPAYVSQVPLIHDVIAIRPILEAFLAPDA